MSILAPTTVPSPARAPGERRSGMETRRNQKPAVTAMIKAVGILHRPFDTMRRQGARKFA